MIELSLEIPTPYLEEFQSKCDLGFALAQELEDDTYRQSYQELNQDIILDNGMLETGESLEPKSLWHAVGMIRPKVVIAPDKLNDFGYGTFQYTEMFRALENPQDACRIGYVVQGETLGRRVYSLQWAVANMCNPILLPYRTDREQTFKTWYKIFPVPDNAMKFALPWIHLLGLKDFKELVHWRHIAQFIPRMSIDTGKVFECEPVDFALGHFDSVAKEQLPVNRGLTIKQRQNAHVNIEILKARLK